MRFAREGADVLSAPPIFFFFFLKSACKMKFIWKLTVAFILSAVLEYCSLSFFTLEPGRQLLNHYFQFDNTNCIYANISTPIVNTTLCGNISRSNFSILNCSTDGYQDWNKDFIINMCQKGACFSMTGWWIAASYAALITGVLVCTTIVFFTELGFSCCCTKQRYASANKHCCTQWCGKSFLLLWVFYPLHAAIMCFILYRDVQNLNDEGRYIWQGFNADAVDMLHQPFLVDMALFFGDVLLLKHIVCKFQSLNTKDMQVSLFLETHAHLEITSRYSQESVQFDDHYPLMSALHD